MFRVKTYIPHITKVNVAFSLDLKISNTLLSQSLTILMYFLYHQYGNLKLIQSAKLKIGFNFQVLSELGYSLIQECSCFPLGCNHFYHFFYLLYLKVNNVNQNTKVFNAWIYLTIISNAMLFTICNYPIEDFTISKNLV